MQFSLRLLALATIAAPLFAHPQPATSDLVQRDALLQLNEPVSEVHDHWKRKGGGGGGGKGGGGGGGGGSRSSGSSSRYVNSDTPKHRGVEVDTRTGDVSAQGSSTSSDPGDGSSGEEDERSVDMISKNWASRLLPRKGGGGSGFRGSSFSSSFRSSSSSSFSRGSSSFSSASSSRGSSSFSASDSSRSYTYHIPVTSSYKSSSKTNSQSSGGGSRTSGTSNAGGATRAGSGPARGYGGGRYYGGGAVQPYRPGSSSPRGILAVPLVGAALLVYPGVWLYGAYAYPYGSPYTFRNRTARRNRTTATTSAVPTATNVPRGNIARMVELVERQDQEGVDETKPVTCICGADQSCGCDEPEDYQTYLGSLIGDGDYSKLNKSLVNVVDINGTSTIVIDGTLPNGTTAPGGVDDASAASDLKAGNMAGYLVMVAMVGFSVFLV